MLSRRTCCGSGPSKPSRSRARHSSRSARPTTPIGRSNGTASSARPNTGGGNFNRPPRQHRVQSGVAETEGGTLPIASNLPARTFTAERPDHVWLADISYLPTDEGWFYLAAIKDMATRQIVGWSMADHLKADPCIDALVMALQRRQPGRGLIHHSDRGVQYASAPYRAVLERHGITRSMSRRGDCLDNEPMESFFASLTKEHVHQAGFRTRKEAKAAVFDYIEIFSNRQRLNSVIGYRTPVEARADMAEVSIGMAA